MTDVISKPMETLPRSYPFLGMLPHMRKDPLLFYDRLARESGGIMPINLGPERIFFVNHPDYVRHVFQDNKGNYVKSHHYRRMRFLLGDGLFTTEGKEWSRQRRTAQPAFNGPCMQAMFGHMAEATEAMTQRWDKIADEGGEVNLLGESMRVALDIALRTLFTTPLTWQAEAIYDALNVLLPEVERRVWAILPLASYLPGRRRRATNKAVKTIDTVVEGLIQARLDEPGEFRDLLAMFIAGEKESGWDGGSMKRLRDQVVVFLVAGHETTATTLTWTWYSLSKNPLADRRLYKETTDTLGDRPIELADMGSLHYARMVFEETLRLYPPGWMLTREALADDEIGGYKIPKGSTVAISAHAVHRHPEFWDNPEGFDPSRFMAGWEKDKDRHPFAYFPFGGGNRACIGKRMALLEAELILSEVARRYRLELVTGQKIEPKAVITIRPSSEIRMRLIKRKTPLSAPVKKAA